MTIYIDGDGCPVKETVIELATQYQQQVHLVTTLDHFTNQKWPSHVQCTYVEAGRDSVDFEIVRRIQATDILVTQDYGLAAMVLGKGAIVLHHTGFEYTVETIDFLLLQRHVSATRRKQRKRTKGPKSFSDVERQKFQQLLEQKISNE